jgi:hypothetical protein
VQKAEGLELEKAAVVGDTEATYRPWLDFANRYADRWEKRISTGNFDLGSVYEFIATVKDVLSILGNLGLQEKREQQEGYIYTYGPITGKAVDRLIDLLGPLMEACTAKFEASDLKRIRQKRAESEAVLEGIRRGA